MEDVFGTKKNLKKKAGPESLLVFDERRND